MKVTDEMRDRMLFTVNVLGTIVEQKKLGGR